MVLENTTEWVWDTKETTRATVLRRGNKEVCFHPGLSAGTAAVRGNKACIADRDYFWEIEIISPLYGTDVMIGVGTIKADLKKFEFQFGSLLGSDEESWGYSYNGALYHNGMLRNYGVGFTEGSIVGIHLDMWLGTLTYYINRKPIGVAFTSLKEHVLYPMVCSTAARSAMRIVCSYSYISSLQLMCLKSLGAKPGLTDKVHLIPGLRFYKEKVFWHFFPPCAVEAAARRQPSKRTNDGSELVTTERDYSDNYSPVNRDMCVICQRPDRANDKANDQSSSGQGSSSKRMCFVCDITF